MPHARREKQPFGAAPESTGHFAWVVTLLITLAIFIAHGPALRGGFVWDDDQYLSNNKNVTEPGGIVRTWTSLKANPQYYPLVFSGFWLEHQLWGLHTVGYHITNILLHAVTSILLGRLLTRLRMPGAWLAAALFALHPVQVESVAWITERKNTLSGLFYLLSLTYFARFSALETDDPPVQRNWNLYLVALACFVGALLSKTVTASLPAVILLVLWWRHGRVTRTDLLALVPMFILGLAFGIMTAYMEHEHVGAKGEEWNLSLLERGLLAGRSVWFYAGKLVWPYPTIFVYPRWKIDAAQWWQYVYPATAIALVVALWLLRRRIGRGPLVAALCFGGTLFPAIGFLNVFPHRYSYVADHFQYLACIFILVPLSAIMAHLARRHSAAARVALSVAALAIVTTLSFRQAHAYQSMETLWRDTIAKNDGAWMAHGNLADSLSGQDRHADAIPHYERSLQLRTESEQIHFNLALALHKVGRNADAMAHYREAVRLVSTYPEPHVNIGAMLLDEGRATEALPWLDKAIKLKPTLVPAHYAMGNALARLGRNDEARRAYAEAIRLQPDFWEAWVNDANLLWAAGKADDAIARYREIIQRNPKSIEARVNLGSVLMQKGATADGIVALREAVRLQPGYVDARIRLAQAFIAVNKGAEARVELEAARRLDPKNEQVTTLLNELLAKPGP